MTLIDIVERFGEGKNIAVVGDICLDVYFKGVNKENLRHPGVSIFRATGKKKFLGMAGNVAVNLARLGAEPVIYTVLDGDAISKDIKKLCEKEKILLESVAQKGLPTISKTRYVASNNEYDLRVDLGEEKPRIIDSYACEELTKKIVFSPDDALILSDYDKGILSNGISKEIIQKYQQEGKPTICNPKPNNIRHFSKVDIICPSIYDAREITGKERGIEVTKKLKEISECENIVINCNGEGIILYNDEVFRTPTYANFNRAVDVVGAGDTLAATLALSRVCGASVREAVEIANYATSVVSEKSGTAYITKRELIKKIFDNEMIKDS